jgi:hypothetical protein
MSTCCSCAGVTSAHVCMEVVNNGTWEDAFQFGDADDTTWNLVGQSFILEVKANRDDAAALLTLSTANGRIVVDSTTLRVIHFLVDKATLQAALKPATYVYDLVMFDGSVPSVRVPLMHGEVKVCQGVTQT